MVPALLELGADVDAFTADGKSPLFYAAYRGFVQVIKKLIAEKADVNEQDDNGNVPLHYISDYEGAMAIVGAGGRLEMWNKQLNSPLHSAYCFYGEGTLSRYLQSQFPEKLLGVKNTNGYTALDTANILKDDKKNSFTIF